MRTRSHSESIFSPIEDSDTLLSESEFPDLLLRVSEIQQVFRRLGDIFSREDESLILIGDDAGLEIDLAAEEGAKGSCESAGSEFRMKYEETVVFLEK
jgi:hypothetical protein